MKALNLIISFVLLSLVWFGDAYADQVYSEEVLVGHAKLIKLPMPASRVSIADPRIADINVLSPTEIYVLGKAVGTTNLILWSKAAGSKTYDLAVVNDIEPLVTSLREVMPEEKDLYVSQASGSIILKGSVANVIAADKATGLADAYLQNLIRSMKSGGSSTGSSSLNDANRNPSGNVATTSAAGAGMAAPKVINFLKIRDPQQVMLEVRIAEISKSLLDQLGVNVSGSGGGSKFSIVSNFPTPNSATASGGALLSLLNSKIKVNGEKDDSLVKVLAEPTIVAISGQEGSFLAGGKVLIPQTNGLGQASTSEFLYGIGLKFMPTVLDQGRINLKVTPEVSDISKELVLQGSNNTSAILPNFTIRMVSTTVQIREGETLVIGGLMKNNVTETVKAFPVLGELPVLGPLFRSKGFASELTELVVVITPSLVAATDRMPELPTDRFTPPSRQEFFLGNALQKEGPSSSSVEGN